MRKSSVWAGVVVVAAAATLTVAAPAGAIAGLQYITMTSAYDSTTMKAFTIYCPAGTVAIGGGAYLSGPSATPRSAR